MFRILIFSLAWALFSSLTAQTTVHAQVVDQATGLGVAYANVGIPAIADGTVTDEHGHFHLRIQDPSSEILVTAIGYTDFRFKAVDMGETINLTPHLYTTPLVTVSASRFGENTSVFGLRNTNGRGLSLGFGSQQLGAEIGAIIPIDQTILLESANFVINHAQGDSLLFRINIYSYTDRSIGEQILRENILIRGGQERGTITIDLTEHHIVLDHDVVLTLQWIRDDAGTGNQGLTFDTKKRGRQGGSYVRYSSVGVLSKLSQLNKRTPCFYFVAKTIE